MAKRKKRKKINSGMTSVLKMGIFLLIVLTITYVIVTYVGRKTVVRGVSMQETLYDGDNIIMDKLSYTIGEPKRFDVICFKSYSEKELLIKRIIGLPGESVRILAGKIYIDGKEIKDVCKDRVENPGLAAGEIVLADDEYFVLGDNRVESIDSRYSEVGNIKKSEILGKALAVIYPFDRIRKIK